MSELSELERRQFELREAARRYMERNNLGVAVAKIPDGVGDLAYHGINGDVLNPIFRGKFVGGLLLCDREQYFAIRDELRKLNGREGKCETTNDSVDE